ncbi:hypothetical protein GA0070624_3440 [Micromonospora rhizosphaerae]|uniref:Uncharacterized protein n=1 Tax=Micromonospora rhizosphaerae TaxID=568872 RepID=A0A1C6SCM7_9ACTN|nr:hypothetical protein [Micromonospora rhizosphaerae]SCL27136.1 hypothetical protein GA0070624_3440 [Micromonospora rhizosphaerae]
MADYGLVVGGVDQGQSFERLVDLVAGVTGATGREVPGESQSVMGTLAGGHVWVWFDGLTDLEPFDNHPYVVDLKLEYPSREPELADKIFTALVADGYQVILLEDGGMIRSSHYREDGDDAGADTRGGQGGSPDRRS